MPHQCIRCGTLHEDGSKIILQGCSNCGSKFFYFVKGDDVKTVQELTSNLTEQDREQMEKDAFELVGEEEPEKPVVLDLESVRIVEPGKFMLDLVDIFKGGPLVYKLEDGKYIIDIASTFKALQKEDK